MSSASSPVAYRKEGDAIAVLPPLIDCHVHFREPGLENKADMHSEGEAAFFGGISVVCDMPNTKPPTQTIAALEDKIHRSGKARCAMFFFFGATAHEHLHELEELWTNPAHAATRARCCGLKLYLDNSTGNMKSSAEVTAAAFALCGRLHIPLVAHCEQAGINDSAAEAHPYDGPASHSLRRPPTSEVASIEEAIALARAHRTPLHIAHLSTEGGLHAVRAARAADPALRLTCEVTPHHLFLSTSDYSCCGARVKVNPPVRAQSHQAALWAGVLDGTVDCIGTDHAPHTLEEKGDSANPPSGMPAVELVVPLLLTVVAGHWPHPTEPCPAVLQAGKLTLEDVVRLLHTNPNAVFALQQSDTPLRRFDLRQQWTVVESELHSKCKWSPYNGWKLTGKALEN